MFLKADSSEIHELSQASGQHEDQGTLLNQETTVHDDYRLAYRFVSVWDHSIPSSSSRHRQTDKRPLRFCLCCIFLSALFLAIFIVLFSLFIFHPNKEIPWQDNVRIELLWTSAFPKLITESAFRLVDCNSDGVLDVIFGYGTGVDTLESNRLLCDLYFNGIYPCNGGVKVSWRSSSVRSRLNCVWLLVLSGTRRSKWTGFMEFRQVESRSVCLELSTRYWWRSHSWLSDWWTRRRKFLGRVKSLLFSDVHLS